MFYSIFFYQRLSQTQDTWETQFYFKTWHVLICNAAHEQQTNTAANDRRHNVLLLLFGISQNPRVCTLQTMKDHKNRISAEKLLLFSIF